MFSDKEPPIKKILSSSAGLMESLQNKEIIFRSDKLQGFDSYYHFMGFMAINVIQVSVIHGDTKLAKRVVKCYESIIDRAMVNESIFRSYVSLNYMERCLLTVGIQYVNNVKGCPKDAYRHTLGKGVAGLYILSRPMYRMMEKGHKANNTIKELLPRMYVMMSEKCRG